MRMSDEEAVIITTEAIVAIIARVLQISSYFGNCFPKTSQGNSLGFLVLGVVE